MREKEKTTNVIYVRHGKTDFPLDRIYCDDKEDPPLNELGQRQAIGAADSLREQEVAAIYASPCARTLTTANTIAAAIDLPVTTNRDLMERRFGIWEGLYFDEIMQQYPEDYRRWKEDNAGFKPEQGESIHDLMARLDPALSGIRDAHPGETVIVVSHVGPIRAALASGVGLAIERYRQLNFDYASMSRINYGKRQNNLVYLNAQPGALMPKA